MMRLAPITLFVYNRLWHLKQTIESLKNNPLAKDSELFIFSDAPKDEKDAHSVMAVRDYLKTIDGFKRVHVNELKESLGLFMNITAGVKDIIDRYGKIIVLEDDLCVSPYFLNFMNEALLFYEDKPKVISISGYMYPVEVKKTETLFLRMIESWGWATWKRGWGLFDSDAGRLSERIKSGNLLRKFNLNGGHNFFKMLKKQASNKISSWAICWYASSLLNENLSLYPAKSLVRNIGFDDSGTHCGCCTEYNTDIFQKQVVVSEIPIEEDKDTIKKIEMFFRISQFKKIAHTIHKSLKPIS